MLTLQHMVDMLKDRDWNLESDDRDRVLEVLAYFADPNDIIPDDLPGIGFLDDTIMVDLAAMDLARALVALGRLERGLAPLETATGLAPDESEAWLLKATLLRRLDRLGDAQAAIERAVAISPQDSEIGLEAGVIAILGGREDAARSSWQSVIEVQPDSLAAETARGYLAQLGAVPATPPEPTPEPAIEGSQP